MKKGFALLLILGSLAAICFAQRQAAPQRSTKRLSAPPAAAKIPTDRGIVDGQTYTHRSLGFSIAFPEEWPIASGDFEKKVRSQGIDLGLRAPAFLPAAERAKLNNSLKTVTDLLIAYRGSDAEKNSAIIRISVEDLALTPQVKDAVDYFDLMRQMYRSMKLPPDFKFSETQAEKLGSKQFAFLDTSNRSGKKRIYATVRGRKAILFTLAYSLDDDLQAFRKILSSGSFNLK